MDWDFLFYEVIKNAKRVCEEREYIISGRGKSAQLRKWLCFFVGSRRPPLPLSFTARCAMRNNPYLFKMYQKEKKREGLGFVIAVIIFAIIATIIYASIAHAEITPPATASYYTYRSCVREGTSGVWTASGERFNENDLTCAMRRRDWGTKFKVTNLANGKSVIVRLNDFGPNKKLHNKGRIIDLSKGAFMKIASLKSGVIKVKVEVLS
jgi:rare lipoprotein A (peptidoglycan hydrolase)